MKDKTVKLGMSMTALTPIGLWVWFLKGSTRMVLAL